MSPGSALCATGRTTGHRVAEGDLSRGGSRERGRPRAEKGTFIRHTSALTVHSRSLQVQPHAGFKDDGTPSIVLFVSVPDWTIALNLAGGYRLSLRATGEDRSSLLAPPKALRPSQWAG